MQKLIALVVLFVASSAEAADVHLLCKLFPAQLTEPKESEAIEGVYTISHDGATVKIGTSERRVPLVPSDQKYEWQWSADHNGAKLTMREEINRLTGHYSMFIDGPKGTMHVTKGTCRKAEPKF